MIPEPLKDKRIASFDAEYCVEGTFFKDKDMKSAVEWLHKNIDRIAPRHKQDYTTVLENRKNNWKLCSCNLCSKIKEIKELVNEAFQDLNTHYTEDEHN